MKVAIIGLGLIGGSIARRLRGFHNCTISAYNRTSETVLLAKQDGAIDEGSSDVGEVMDNADLIILCLYPQLNVDMVKNNLSHIKPGAVITDVSGVKGFMIDEMSKILPDNVDLSAHILWQDVKSAVIKVRPTHFQQSVISDYADKEKQTRKYCSYS